jgi:hypothetical protein
MTPLETTILAALLTWAPAHRSETQGETAARYASVAADLAAVATSEPIATLGPYRTAMALATVAYLESGLSPTVDDGSHRGDQGRSVCILQIMVGAGRTPEGWTSADLLDDRRKCVAAGLRLLRASWGCGHGAERWTSYASGTCVTSDRMLEAGEVDRARMTSVRERWWRRAIGKKWVLPDWYRIEESLATRE